MATTNRMLRKDFIAIPSIASLKIRGEIKHNMSPTVRDENRKSAVQKLAYCNSSEECFIFNSYSYQKMRWLYDQIITKKREVQHLNMCFK